MSHIERTGHAIDQSQPGEKQQGRDQVDDHVLDTTVKLCAGFALHQQGERCHQHDLEPDKEVEDIAGEHGAGFGVENVPGFGLAQIGRLQLDPGQRLLHVLEVTLAAQLATAERNDAASRGELFVTIAVVQRTDPPDTGSMPRVRFRWLP